MQEVTVTISTLDKAISGVLDEYNAGVMSKMRALVDDAMRKLVRITKATAPRRTGQVCKKHIVKSLRRHAEQLCKKVVCARRPCDADAST